VRSVGGDTYTSWYFTVFAAVPKRGELILEKILFSEFEGSSAHEKNEQTQQ
jgi:hypothetical protein